MDFKPFEQKLVAILNESAETGRALNALAHMSVGLGANVTPKEKLRLQDYTDEDGGRHPSISDIPFIVLKGRSGQIRTLRKELIASGIPFTDFTDTMIEGTYVEQHARTKNTKEEGLNYIGICLFGDWHQVTDLTKKFSLWK